MYLTKSLDLYFPLYVLTPQLAVYVQGLEQTKSSVGEVFGGVEIWRGAFKNIEGELSISHLRVNILVRCSLSRFHYVLC